MRKIIFSTLGDSHDLQSDTGGKVFVNSHTSKVRKELLDYLEGDENATVVVVGDPMLYGWSTDHFADISFSKNFTKDERTRTQARARVHGVYIPSTIDFAKPSPPPKKIFLEYGFDIDVDVKDTFTLTCVGGVLLFHLKKTDGTEITARRRWIDENTTEPFEVNSLTRDDRNTLIYSLLGLDMSHANVTRLLGLSSSYIPNMLRGQKMRAV